MNDPILDSTTADSVAEYGAEVDQCIRRNPTSTLFFALGVGLVVALIVRALRPEPPRHRVVRLLHDLESRLHDSAEPALRRAGALAGNGMSALNDGLHSGEARLERAFRDARKRVRRFLS